MEFIITENPGPIIIGKCRNEAVEIITVNAVAEMTVCGKPKNIQDAHALKDAYHDRFDGIGKFLEIKPIISPPRKYPVQWFKLRNCFNPRNFNLGLQCTYHRTPNGGRDQPRVSGR